MLSSNSSVLSELLSNYKYFRGCCYNGWFHISSQVDLGTYNGSLYLCSALEWALCETAASDTPIILLPTESLSLRPLFADKGHILKAVAIFFRIERSSLFPSKYFSTYKSLWNLRTCVIVLDILFILLHFWFTTRIIRILFAFVTHTISWEIEACAQLVEVIMWNNGIAPIAYLCTCLHY